MQIISVWGMDDASRMDLVFKFNRWDCLIPCILLYGGEHYAELHFPSPNLKDCVNNWLALRYKFAVVQGRLQEWFWEGGQSPKVRSMWASQIETTVDYICKHLKLWSLYCFGISKHKTVVRPYRNWPQKYPYSKKQKTIVPKWFHH